MLQKIILVFIFTTFQQTNITSLFKIAGFLGFISKMFLKLWKFQPRYSQRWRQKIAVFCLGREI